MGGMNELQVAAEVASELADGGLAEIAELDDQINQIRCLGPRHWAVRTLEWHKLKAQLKTPDPLPDSAGAIALAGLQAACEDGGIGAVVQVGWDGVCVAVGIRLCRDRDFDRANMLCEACLPIVA